jgi:hypothetical protein
MPQLTFYRQHRRDEGVRTGVDIDGETLLHDFEPGADEIDPVLSWWVDVRCEAVRVPEEPAEARKWFLTHAESIQAGLRKLAEEMRAGIDFDTWPLPWKVPKPPRGVHITIGCSASRRLPARKMADALSELAGSWPDTIRALPEARAFSR